MVGKGWVNGAIPSLRCGLGLHALCGGAREPWLGRASESLIVRCPCGCHQRKSAVTTKRKG